MKILITAGPTREYLDDVRYLSNASTGRMGYALARAAAAAGHQVTLVHGPTCDAPPAAARRVAVTSALEMFDAVNREFSDCDAFIACAAVSDYRPRQRAAQKMKREKIETLSLELVANPDIAAEMGRRKRPGQVLVCFALETADGEANARAKLVRKNADAVVLNMAAAIGAEATEVTLFTAGSDTGETVRGSKDVAAQRIVELCRDLWRRKNDVAPGGMATGSP